ncbi:MAG: MFS transporter [Chloroflexota bacterium]|nr:MFS transporter [Chloroflexota bacterium]
MAAHDSNDIPDDRPRITRRPWGAITRKATAFQSRNFRVFWVGQLISITGTWIQTIAQSWLVVDELNASAFDLGMVNVLRFAPILVFGLFAGVVIDRVSTRLLLIVTQAISAVLAALLAILVLSGSVELWHVYVLSGILGVINAFDMPARQTFVSELVERDQVMNAVALNSALFNTGRVLGPAIAGVLLAAFGSGVCFALNAVTFSAAIAGLLMIRGTSKPDAPKGSTASRLAEGLRYVRSTPAILLPITLVAFVATFGMNFNVWIPLLAKDVFATGPRGFGLLMTAMGIGSLAGAVTLVMRARTPRRGLMLGAALALGMGEVALALAGAGGAPVLLGAGLLAMVGFCMTTTMALANTTVQTTATDELRGRVMSVYMTVFAGTAPFGSLLSGAIADRVSTTASVMVGGSVTAVAALTLIGAGLRPARESRPATIRPASPTGVSFGSGREVVPDLAKGGDD